MRALSRLAAEDSSAEGGRKLEGRSEASGSSSLPECCLLAALPPRRLRNQLPPACLSHAHCVVRWRLWCGVCMRTLRITCAHEGRGLAALMSKLSPE